MSACIAGIKVIPVVVANAMRRVSATTSMGFANFTNLSSRSKALSGIKPDLRDSPPFSWPHPILASIFRYLLISLIRLPTMTNCTELPKLGELRSSRPLGSTGTLRKHWCRCIGTLQ